MKILIVEDEISLADDIKVYLSSHKTNCETVADVKNALEKVSLYSYDCIILDIGLPDGTGFRVLEHLREIKKADGVIIISAKGSLEDKIRGLEIGADDYITKPFHLAELAVRVLAVVRRRQFRGYNSQEVGHLTFYLTEQEVRYKGILMNLTPSEFRILHYFIASPNKVHSKTALAEYLLGEQSDFVDGHQLVYTHIKNLKKKLNEVGCPEYIRTVYGSGYKFQIQ
ncbi:MAG: response regulator transcription factor [Cyclobacteriaceae bacterium]|nr:response regulator transcription factor [Cyclobacteriaceae bacterium]